MDEMLTKILMTALAAAVILAAVGHAAAQQQSPVDLQVQRNNFMAAFAQCDSASIVLQQQIAALQERIKTLEAKPAEK